MKASDFTVFENGKPQKVASFDYQNVDEAALLQEKTTVIGKATVADLLNNNFAANAGALRDHRLIVMFFDLSSMQPEDIDRAVDASKDYINKKMQPADLVAVVSMQTGLSVDLDFYGGQDGTAGDGRAVQRDRGDGIRKRGDGEFSGNGRRRFELRGGRHGVQQPEYGSRAVCDPRHSAGAGEGRPAEEPAVLFGRADAEWD